MLVYQGKTSEFIEDVRNNTLTDIMTDNFSNRWGHKVGASELTSWQNSLSRVRDLIEIAQLHDNMIALEYEIPYSQQNRIDCLLFGCGEGASKNVVLIELKQWSSVKALPMKAISLKHIQEEWSELFHILHSKLRATTTI